MTHCNLHSQLPLSDLFRRGYLPGVPWAQGFLVVQVHLACPEIKADIVTASLCGFIILSFFSKNVLLVVFKHFILFESSTRETSPSTYRFSCFPRSAIFSHFSRLTLQINEIDHLAFSTVKLQLSCMYIHDAVHIKSFFLQSSQEDPVVPGFLWDPLCPSENKQTNTNRSPSPKEKKWLMATITTQSGWPTC